MNSLVAQKVGRPSALPGSSFAINQNESKHQSIRSDFIRRKEYDG